MRYRSSYKGLQQKSARPKIKTPSNIGMPILLGAFVILFIGSVFLFRHSKPEKVAEAAGVVSVTGAPVVVNPAALLNPSAALFTVSSHKSAGSASRSVENGVFHLNIRSTLPGIDRTSQFYQAWLVRPVPYDYVSAGELVTNDSGAFVLDWNGSSDKDYSGYTDLVITLQARNADPDPQAHIAEGEFGK